ncbi:hypothetical protein AL013_08905 [Mariprofundus ferrooxydans]|nr:hypothetical protein AL013_08905 [Mariprofundus ferrooxydans]
MLLVIAAVATVLVMVAVVMIAAAIIPAIVMVSLFPVVLFLIARDIVALVPVVVHKIDPFAAGVVSVAVLAPMFDLIPRYAQIDGRAVCGSPLDNDRLTIDHAWRRKTAYIELAIEAGLADTDRDADVGSQCRSGCGCNGESRCDKKSFHV